MTAELEVNSQLEPIQTAAPRREDEAFLRKRARRSVRGEKGWSPQTRPIRKPSEDKEDDQADGRPGSCECAELPGHGVATAFGRRHCAEAQFAAECRATGQLLRDGNKFGGIPN